MPKKSLIPEITFDFTEFGLISSFIRQIDFGLHTHSYVELVYVAKGHGRHVFMNRSYPIIAGDFFVINTSEAHGYDATRDLQVSNMIVAQEFLAEHYGLLQTIQGFPALCSLEPLFRAETSFRYKLHLPSESRGRIESMLHLLEKELYEKTDGYKAIATGLFLQIVTLAGRAFSSRDSQPMHRDFSGKEKAVAQAISYLESEFDKEISLKEIASFACMSGSRLSHVFKEATGTSLMDYLLRYRLDRARELLREGKDSISEIAYTVGFHDPGYFSRAFRKHFGFSPREARG